MNEEVIISIKANAEQFKQTLNKITKDIRVTTASTEEFSAIVKHANKLQMRNITKQLKKGIQETTLIIKDMQQELLIASNTGASPEFINRLKHDIAIANSELKDMNSRLNMVGGNTSIRKLTGVFDGLKARANQFGNSLARLGKRLSTAFIFAAFGTFRRGFRDAINLSETARSKFDALATTIGTALVPIIDTFVRYITRAFVWVAGLIKAFTGFNIIQKAIDNTSKKIGGLSKSTKGASKSANQMLAGFDEINNIETPSADSGDIGGIGSDLQSQLDSFGNLQQMLEDMNNLDFAWVDKIKQGFQWIKDNWQFVVLGIMAITLAIGALKLSSLLASIGIAGMTLPLLALGLAILGITAVVIGIIELFKDGGNQTKAWTLILGGLVAIVLAVWLAFGSGAAIIAGIVAVVVALALLIIKNWDTVVEWFNIGVEKVGKFFSDLWTGIQNLFGGIATWFGQKIDEIVTYWKGFPARVSAFVSNTRDRIVGFFSGIGAWFGQRIDEIVTYWSGFPQRVATFVSNTKNRIVNFFSGIGAWFGQRVTDIVNQFKSLPSKVMTFITQLYNNIKTKFTDIGKRIGDSMAGALKKAINSVLQTAVNIINGFIKGINFAIGIINKIPGVKITRLNLMSVPSFDVGTPNVPYDMIAQIHKGEAIIPEKFNDEKYFGGNNDVDMGETNSLLEEIITVLMGQNKTLTPAEIGRIATEYIQAQSRLRGESIV